MREKRYFYFADSHSFEYPYCVKFVFKHKDGQIIHRKERKKWKEVRDYSYYGEPVKCIIPEDLMDYEFVFEMLNSKHSDNIFGAINYLLYNYKDKFLRDVNSNKIEKINTEILYRYFGEIEELRRQA